MGGTEKKSFVDKTVEFFTPYNLMEKTMVEDNEDNIAYESV